MMRLFVLWSCLDCIPKIWRRSSGLAHSARVRASTREAQQAMYLWNMNIIGVHLFILGIQIHFIFLQLSSWDQLHLLSQNPSVCYLKWIMPWEGMKTSKSQDLFRKIINFQFLSFDGNCFNGIQPLFSVLINIEHHDERNKMCVAECCTHWNELCLEPKVCILPPESSVLQEKKHPRKRNFGDLL